LEFAKAEGVENPFFVPYETSVEMWHVEKWEIKLMPFDRETCMDSQTFLASPEPQDFVGWRDPMCSNRFKPWSSSIYSTDFDLMICSSTETPNPIITYLHCKVYFLDQFCL
jgi:hypothetical protein